jgi:Phosphotransferase enzyme family
MAIDYSELSLPNEAAIVFEAKAIAAHYIIVSAQECELQGEFSRTIDIGMDGTHYVVQLRTEPIVEENAQQAFQILGPLVAVPTRVFRDSSVVPYEYIMPRIPGVPWSEVSGWSPGFHINAAAQVGSIIGKCCGESPKGGRDTIDSFIIPPLEFYLKWDEPLITPFRESIQSLLERVDDLRKLPLCWTHWDLNMMNIMVRGPDDPTITGVLDWEEAFIDTFGDGNWRPNPIHVSILQDSIAWYQVPENPLLAVDSRLSFD